MLDPIVRDYSRASESTTPGSSSSQDSFPSAMTVLPTWSGMSRLKPPSDQNSDRQYEMIVSDHLPSLASYPPTRGVAGPALRTGVKVTDSSAPFQITVCWAGFTVSTDPPHLPAVGGDAAPVG